MTLPAPTFRIGFSRSASTKVTGGMQKTWDGKVGACRLLSRDFEQPLAASHANDPDPSGIDAVDYPKRRHDDFPQKLDAELGDDASRQREAFQFLDALENFGQEPLCGLGNGKFVVMAPDLFQIVDGGPGESNRRRVGGALQESPNRFRTSARECSRPASRSIIPWTTAFMNA